jgi:hypothetical protein
MSGIKISEANQHLLGEQQLTNEVAFMFRVTETISVSTVQKKTW